MAEAKKKNPVPKNFQQRGEVITTSKGYKAKDEMQVIAPVANGAIGTSMQKIQTKETKESNSKNTVQEKVAIHSTRNVYMPGVGKVLKGYNIVKREIADKWLSRDHIREATPEEVAREYGL